MNEQRTNEHGRAEFTDFPAETSLRLLVRDAMGSTAADQIVTLEPDEWRTVEIALTREFLAFSGVVRDEQGLPLADAAVEFVGSGTQGRRSVTERSDADGRFAFRALTNPVGTLRVRKLGFAPVTIQPFEIPPPGVVADIRMDRGLRLTLRVVDERGAPVRADSLRLDLAGERPFQGRRRGENEWDFASLPRDPLTAIGMVGGREYRRGLEPLIGDQDFTVPVHGALEVELRLPSLEPNSSLRLVLSARNNRRVSMARDLEDTLLQTRRFEPLLPGDYQLEVMHYVRDGQRAQWRVRGASQRVTITGGAPTRIELER